MNNVTERFLKVLDDLVDKRKAKSVRQICMEIGLKPSQVSGARTSEREIPIKYAEDLQNLYNVNKSFILQEEGEMYLSNSADTNAKGLLTPNARDMGALNYPFDPQESPFMELGDGLLVMVVPLVTERAYMGYLSGYADPEWIEDLPKHTITVRKEHRGAYRAFEALGESMTDGTERSIIDGSVVTGRVLLHHHWSAKLNYRKWPFWVIVHKTDGIIIKEIIDHNVKTGVITYHSLNPDKELYPDTELHLDEVKELYNIVHIGKNIY